MCECEVQIEKTKLTGLCCLVSRCEREKNILMLTKDVYNVNRKFVLVDLGRTRQIGVAG